MELDNLQCDKLDSLHINEIRLSTQYKTRQSTLRDKLNNLHSDKTRQSTQWRISTLSQFIERLSDQAVSAQVFRDEGRWCESSRSLPSRSDVEMPFHYVQGWERKGV